MTDKQPEALRLAELEAVGAGGVQALSAAPGVTSEQRRLIGVIADKIEDGTIFQSGIYPKKDLARFVRNMLDVTPTAPAASPTPPAEQQARIKTMAEEHADELMVAHLDGRMCGHSTEPAGAQQPAPPTAQAEGWTATAQHQTYRCKIKSRKQIDKEIPRDQQGWWADVAAGKKLLLRPAVQADIDRCHLGPRRSKNPDDYMCETQTNGSLVSKIALEYMNPEENVFAAIPAPPTSAEGVEHG